MTVDESSEDLKLAIRLAVSEPDDTKLETALRASDRVRPKWDHPEYVPRLIKAARRAIA